MSHAHEPIISKLAPPFRLRPKKGNKKGPFRDLFSAHQHARGFLTHVADAPTYDKNECPHGTSPKI